MPASESTRLATRPSLTARMSGMPPATAASKASATPRRRASSYSSAPWWASSALLAVTTCLPAAQLHHHVDGGIVEHPGRVADHGQRADVQPLTRAGEVGVGDGGQGQRGPGPLLQHLASGLQDLDDAGPDGAQAQQTDTNVT